MKGDCRGQGMFYDERGKRRQLRLLRYPSKSINWCRRKGTVRGRVCEVLARVSFGQNRTLRDLRMQFMVLGN
jgi:hypothetical protein